MAGSDSESSQELIHNDVTRLDAIRRMLEAVNELLQLQKNSHVRLVM